MDKQVTYQKVESLRDVFLPKLDNTVNNNSIFNTKCHEFSTKWYMLFHFHSSACAYNHPYLPYNLHQKSVPPLQLFWTSLFHPYLFIKSYLQHPLTLPSSTPQQFFFPLFLRTGIPTIYIKSIFPISAI